jgi:hypothetical protein
MKRQKVDSSFIKAAGYDPDSKTLELTIKGNKGVAFQYSGVTRAKFQGFLDAESKGSYFNAKIKDKYPETKVEA